MSTGAEAPAKVGYWDSWADLIDKLGKRSTEPWQHVGFGVYFLVGVVVLGAFGTWCELGLWFYQNGEGGLNGIRTSLVTFFPALVGSTALQMVLEEHKDTRMRAFAFLLFVFFLIAAFLLTVFRGSASVGIVLGGVASLVALWVWVVANAKNPGLQDRVETDDPVGGSTDEPPSGDLSGFQT